VLKLLKLLKMLPRAKAAKAAEAAEATAARDKKRFDLLVKFIFSASNGDREKVFV
jgi:hypothetical protein